MSADHMTAFPDMDAARTHPGQNIQFQASPLLTQSSYKSDLNERGGGVLDGPIWVTITVCVCVV